MAGSVNKVILIGHLGADPEMRQTTAGVPIARLRVATTETWNDRATGQKRYATEIKARDMKMLGARPEGSSGVGPAVSEPPGGGEAEDDVPF